MSDEPAKAERPEPAAPGPPPVLDYSRPGAAASAATVKCGNCGMAIDAGLVPPDGLVKCPRCGATTDVAIAKPPYEFPFLGLFSLIAAVVSFPIPFVYINPLARLFGPFRGSIALAFVALAVAAWSLVRRGNWLAWWAVVVGVVTLLYCLLAYLYSRSAM